MREREREESELIKKEIRNEVVGLEEFGEVAKNVIKEINYLFLLVCNENLA